MKSLILLFGLACSASAQQGITNVHEVANSTQSIIQTITMSATSAKLDVAASVSSAPVGGYFAIEVYNTAGSGTTLNCGFDVSNSTTLASAWYGREIPAGIGVYFATPQHRKVYCGQQATVTGVRATISLFK